LTVAGLRTLERVQPLDAPPLSPEEQAKVRMTREDLEHAMQRVVPGLMRELHVERPSKSWDEIGGLDAERKELHAFLELNRATPEELARRGYTQVPRGLLAIGPPGVGKTDLARAAASELGKSLIIIKGSDIFSHLYSDSMHHLRAIFETAH